MSSSLSGSNQTVTIASGGTINVTGSNDTVDMLGGGYVGLISCSGDGVIMSGGTLLTTNSVTNVLLAGSNDIVGTGTNNNFNVSGSNDVMDMGSLSYVGVLGGNNDDVNMVEGTLVTAGTVTNLLLNGSNNIVNAGANNSLDINGSDDVIVMGSLSYVGVVSGTGDDINMTGGTLLTAGTVTNLLFSGSNNTISTGANNSLDVSGSSNTINAGSTNVVAILAGNADTIDMSGGTLEALSGATNLVLNGSNDLAQIAAGIQIDISGSSDAVSIGGQGVVAVLSGNEDNVTLTGGTLQESSGVSNLFLIGSSDFASSGLDGYLSLEGSTDTAAMGNGSTLWMDVGNYDTASMSSSILDIAAATNSFLIGSSDQATSGTDGYISIEGTSDIAHMGNGSTVWMDVGNYDTASMSSSILDIAAATNSFLIGSNNQATSGVDGYISVEGTSNVVHMGTGSTVWMDTGNNNTASVTAGVLDIAAATDTFLIGSNDQIFGGTGKQISLSSGSLNNFTMSSGTIDLASTSTDGVVGSSDIVVGANDGVYVTGSSNTISLVSGGYVSVTSGNEDLVYLSAGSMNIAGVVTNAFLIGSNDTASVNSGGYLSVEGSEDIVNAASNSTVWIDTGTDDTVNMDDGELWTAAGITNLGLNGSNDTAHIGPDGIFSFNGNNDVVDMGNGYTLGISGGSAETINMSGGVLSAAASPVTASLDGSNDTVSIGTGSDFSVSGNNDTIKAALGSTIALNASDSGDTIIMVGGSIILGASLSNITIVGTGDQLSGTDASLAGPVYTTITDNVGPGGTIIATTVTITPAIIYDAGDIQEIVGFFEANPNLSESQIAAVEGDGNYQANLDNYLSTANLYNSSNALPSNILAMLDGYSSVYTAVLGVNTSLLSEATYIEQQFAWVENEYPDYFQTDGLQTVLQNLMGDLESTNSQTDSMVSLAVYLLEQGQDSYASNPSSNQDPLLDDTGAKLALEAANGAAAANGNVSEEINVGRNDPWNVVITPDAAFGSGSSYIFKYETGTWLSQFLNALNTYVTPIVDALAVVTQNYELILVAAALDAVQAGQDFASGADLQGVFSTLEAIGGTLYDVGAATNSSSSIAKGILDADENWGSDLSNGVSVAEGIDGVITSSQEGNALSAITSALGGVSGVAGLANASSLQQYADVGSALGSATNDLGNGNIIAGLASLIEGAQISGVTNLNQDVSIMLDAFEADVYVPTVNALSWLANLPSEALTTLADYLLGNTSDSQSAGSTAPPVSNVQAWEAFGEAWGPYLIPAASYQSGSACQVGANVPVDGQSFGTSIMTAPNSTVQGLSVLDGCLNSVLGNQNEPPDENLGVYWGTQNDNYVTGQSLSQEMPALTSFITTEETGVYTSMGGGPAASSLNATVPSSTSGATVLSGIDLSTHTAADLINNFGFPAALVNQWESDGLLAQGPGKWGLQGPAAQNKISALTAANDGINPVSVPASLASQIVQNEATYYYNDTANWYDKNVASSATNRSFSDLPEDTQVALTQLDVKGILQNTTYALGTQVLNNEWYNVINNLGDWTPNTFLLDTTSYFGIEKLILDDYLGPNSPIAPKGFNPGI